MSYFSPPSRPSLVTVLSLLLGAFGSSTIAACSSTPSAAVADAALDRSSPSDRTAPPDHSAPGDAGKRTDAARDGTTGDAGANDDASDAGMAKDAPETDASDAQLAEGPCPLGFVPDGGTVVTLQPDEVTLSGLAGAVAAAKANPSNYVIQLPIGSFDLSGEVMGKAAFDVSGIAPTTGRLIITGAGSSQTTLVLSQFEPPTYGKDAAHICFVGMHFAKPQYTASQGTVVSVTDDSLVLHVQEGFPTPGELYTPNAGEGYYLRQYTADASDPELVAQYTVDGGNQQETWGSPVELDGGNWSVSVHSRGQWPVGSYLGIKAKTGVLPDAGDAAGGGAGSFVTSNDIVFNDILWTEASRLEFDETNNVQVLNSRIERPPPIDGQTPCMATSGGGPQINGGKLDGGTSGHVIANFIADSTGDDSIAFFNGAKGIVVHSQLKNSFSRRCINSNASARVTVDSYTEAHTVNCLLVLPDAGGD